MNVLERETVRETVREAIVVVACRPNEKNGIERPSACHVSDYYRGNVRHKAYG